VKKEGKEVLQELEKIPLQPMVKTMVMHVVPLQPVKVNGGADIHPAGHQGCHARAGGWAQRRL